MSHPSAADFVPPQECYAYKTDLAMGRALRQQTRSTILNIPRHRQRTIRAKPRAPHDNCAPTIYDALASAQLA